MREADVALREYVLVRDGMRCVICGSRKELQAGHLFTRAAMSVRWHLRNVFAQCKLCNERHELDASIMRTWWLFQFGYAAYDDLYQLRWQIEDVTRAQLVEVVERCAKPPHPARYREVPGQREMVQRLNQWG